jgi:uncharacterized protein (TIGR02246 family)
MHHFRFSSLLLSSALVTILAASCAPKPITPPDTRPADEAAIRAASAAWSAASQARDAQKAASFYADDGAMYPEKSPIVKGKDAILKEWTGMLAVPGPGLSFQTTGVEVARSGDLAYETGTYDFAMADKKGKVTDEKGKYVVVWKKQPSGDWKVVADIFNSGL